MALDIPYTPPNPDKVITQDITLVINLPQYQHLGASEMSATKELAKCRVTATCRNIQSLVDILNILNKDHNLLTVLLADVVEEKKPIWEGVPMGPITDDNLPGRERQTDVDVCMRCGHHRRNHHRSTCTEFIECRDGVDKFKAIRDRRRREAFDLMSKQMQAQTHGGFEEELSAPHIVSALPRELQ